jgi:hypothetical protein
MAVCWCRDKVGLDPTSRCVACVVRVGPARLRQNSGVHGGGDAHTHPLVCLLLAKLNRSLRNPVDRGRVRVANRHPHPTTGLFPGPWASVEQGGQVLRTARGRQQPSAVMQQSRLARGCCSLVCPQQHAAQAWDSAGVGSGAVTATAGAASARGARRGSSCCAPRAHQTSVMQRSTSTTCSVRGGGGAAAAHSSLRACQQHTPAAAGARGGGEAVCAARRAGAVGARLCVQQRPCQHARR